LFPSTSLVNASHGFATGAAHGAHGVICIVGHCQLTLTLGSGAHGVEHVLHGCAHGVALHGLAHVVHLTHPGFAQLGHVDDADVDVAATATDANMTATTTAITISAAFLILLLLVNCVCRGGLNLPYKPLLYS